MAPCYYLFRKKASYRIWCLFMFVSLDGDHFFISYNSSFLLIFQLLRSRRPFVAEFTDAMGNEIFTVRFQQMVDVFHCKYIIRNLLRISILMLWILGSGPPAILAHQQLHLCRSGWQGTHIFIDLPHSDVDTILIWKNTDDEVS